MLNLHVGRYEPSLHGRFLRHPLFRVHCPCGKARSFVLADGVHSITEFVDIIGYGDFNDFYPNRGLQRAMQCSSYIK